MATPGTGELVYLKSVLTNVHIYGVVTDGETPDQFTATLEIAGENATLSTAALVGPRGPAGQNAFALRLQLSTIDDPEDLPTNLTDDDQDVGKYWIMNQFDTINEVQVITISGGATGGTFPLTYNGQPALGIARNASAVTVQAALIALSNLSTGDVVVDGPDGGPWTVEFQGGKAGQNQPVMVSSAADLTGGTPAINVSTIQEGETNLIGSRAYIWFGDHYRILMMGSEGPPGPVPQITWGVDLLDPDDDDLTDWVEQSGTAYNPSLVLHIKAPRGPRGYNATIRDATDYDDSEEPVTGQVMMWDGENWGPAYVGSIIAKPFTVPEAGFTNFEGLSTRAPIGSFAVPPQDFPWKPIVWGKVKAIGLELDSDPLIIGCEVRLGHPTTGQLIARGFGNNSGWANLSPHASTPTDESTAITPDNDTALVIANHTGAAGTVYVNLYNDGLTGVYIFNKHNAQLFVQVMPV